MRLEQILHWERHGSSIAVGVALVAPVVEDCGLDNSNGSITWCVSCCSSFRKTTAQFSFSKRKNSREYRTMRKWAAGNVYKAASTSCVS